MTTLHTLEHALSCQQPGVSQAKHTHNFLRLRSRRSCSSRPRLRHQHDSRLPAATKQEDTLHVTDQQAFSAPAPHGSKPSALVQLDPELQPPPDDEDTRWVTVVGLSALVALICSVDRAAMSVAILPMSEQFGWSDSTKGAINSAFFIGYTLTNLFGGYLATIIPAKRVLGAGVVLWSLFTMATPSAAAISLPLLIFTRAVMGAGEGVTYPSVQNVVKGWVPRDKRSRSLAAIYSGGSVGTIVSLLTAPLLISAYGWPAVFEIYGALGLLWILAWQPLVDVHPPLLKAQGIAASTPVRFRDLPWRQFFSNKPFWAILLAHASFGVGHYVSLSWLPTYYNQVFGVDLGQSALLSVLPWVVTVVAHNFAGWLADWLVNARLLNMTDARKLLQGIGSLGPAACLLYLALGGTHKGDVVAALGLLTATLALGGFQSAGFASNHQDISIRYAGILFGVTNATASFMGFFSVYATGLILDATHSWALIWEIVAGFYVLGAVFYLAWASADNQFDEELDKGS